MQAVSPAYSNKQIVFGDKRADLMREEVLADLLRVNARKFPQKLALIFGEQQLTYAELDRLAHSYATQLQKIGARPGQLVGLCLPRGLDLIVWQAALAYAGLGWLPFEFDTPGERIQTCLDDAHAFALLSNTAKFSEYPFVSHLLDFEELARSAADHSTDQPADLLTCQITDPAYVIYTSGSTGKPKGIQITQASICHFLRSENSVLGICPTDKVYQGFSVAFDMSFEEIWISYLVGATLWIAPKELTNDPEALSQALRQQQITVLHAVPTLLALLDPQLPDLRLVNLGGEMCPPSLVERWDNKVRQLFNTYGPTEATVSASLARLAAGAAVSIGKPLPNYTLFVINPDSTEQNRHILNYGETGELCISGPGVAAGYLGRPELTADKFLLNPWASDQYEQRYYRTGDLAQIDTNGTINCLGRVDDQVKLRGFRVELGEIEACLSEFTEVANAAVILKSWQEMPVLVAYLQLEATTVEQAQLLRELKLHLRKKLPAYMIPAQFQVIEIMPRLTSGKIDRNQLKALDLNLEQIDTGASDLQAELLSPVGRRVYDVLSKLFPGQSLNSSSDFFADLGGHSLLMARLVSELRRTPELAAFKINDILQLREVAKLIEFAESLAQMQMQSAQASTSKLPPTGFGWRRLLCGIAQTFAIPWLVAFRMIQWLAPFFAYHFFTGEPGDSIPRAIILSVGVFILLTLAEFALAIAGKWLIAGRLRQGRYPLWGLTYFRWWLADRLVEAAPTYMLAGSAMYRWWLRALGAKIGADVMIGSITLRAPDLLSIADYVSIGNAVNLENAHIENGELVLGPINLERHAYVGSYSVLQGHTELGEYAHLNGQSALAASEGIPRNQVWGGSPASYQAEFNTTDMPARPTLSRWRAATEALFFIAGSLFISALFFIPVFPSFIVIDWLDNTDWLSKSNSANPAWQLSKYFVLAFPAVAILILATALLSGAIRWLFLPRLKAGRYPVHSNTYLGKWLVNQIQDASLNVLHGVYATVYAPYWYRLLGAKIGKDAEISTALGVVPDMLTMGDETFVADAVMLGDEQIDGGWMEVQATTVARRSFIGNGAYIPDGTTIPENVLIGVHTHAPANQQMHSGDTWLGSPALNLPAREQTSGYPEHLTYHPSWHRRLGRGLIEAFRIISPHALVTAVGYTVVSDLMPIAAEERWLEVVLYLALAGLLYGLASFLFVVILKWLLIGRYRKSNHPMWTSFVWISEAITNLYEGIAIPNFMRYLRGTPLLPWAFRILGAKIGKNVYMDSTDITEFDCVTIGDDSVVNALACPQTHLFEDRIMKIDHVIIGKGVNLGPRSSVLYSAELADQVELGALSLVMKGEYLPANTSWRGCPAGLK